MTPEALRQAANSLDRKGDRLFSEGRADQADNCWDRAITLRLQANAIEDRNREGCLARA